MQLDANQIIAAQARISKIIAPTQLTYSAPFSEILGHDTYLKWENKLRTGSFKERGVLNTLSCLSNKEKSHGVCAASAGNHALALSYYSKQLGVACQIVMPKNAPLIKIQATERNGAKVILLGETFNQAYQFALEMSRNENSLFVSPFDNLTVMAGQGTCAIEILDDLPEVDSIFIPVGGGGLISGMATLLKERKPDLHIVGVQSEWAQNARDGRHSDTSIIRPTTIADGIAIKIRGQLTQPIIDSKVDQLITVSEKEIARAIVSCLELERTILEGAAAAAFAALVKAKLPERCKKTVVIATGSNIDMNILSRIIERDMGERGRLLRLLVSVPDRPGSLNFTTGLIAEYGANVLQVMHDRSFSEIPGNVDITFVLEVRDLDHKLSLIKGLSEKGLPTRELAL